MFQSATTSYDMFQTSSWPADKSAGYLALMGLSAISPIAAGVVFLILGILKDSPVPWIPYVMIGLGTILLPLIAWRVPSNFVFEPRRLVIRSLFGFTSLNVDFSNIMEVRLGNIAGFVGWRFLSTFGFSNAVVIVRRSGMNVLITPVDPTAFVERLKGAMNVVA